MARTQLRIVSMTRTILTMEEDNKELKTYEKTDDNIGYERVFD